MKKLFLLLAASGMIIASATAQTQRVNRTNTRAKDVTTTQQQETVVLPTVQADPIEQRSTGTNGIDGSVNDKANSGMNRSSSLQYDYRTGTVPPQNTPAATTITATPATPAAATPTRAATSVR